MKTLISTIILGLFTLAIQVNVQAQDVYVPSGTSGIGTSTTSNVGIGVSNPSEKLHVSGNLLLGGSSTRSLFLQGDASKLWKLGSVGSFFSLGYDGTDYMTLNNGKVGIGKATPAYTLDVNGDIQFVGGIYKNDVPFLSSPNTNLLLGFEAGKNIGANGIHNVYIGRATGRDAGDDSYNVYVGRLAGGRGSKNVSLGNEAGAGSDGDMNVFVGRMAGRSTLSDKNVFIGRLAANNYVGTNGDGGNIALGAGAATQMGTNATYNTIMGTSTASYLNGTRNTILGFNAGQHTNASSSNIFIGQHAGWGSAGVDNSVSSNIFIGAYSGAGVETGTHNVYLGTLAGRDNLNGTHNVFLGNETGRNNTGSNNVFIGKTADIAGASSDRLIIDNGNTTTAFIDGDFSARTLKVDGTIDASGYTINGQPLTAGGSSLWSIDGDNLYRSTGRVAIGVSDYSILNTTSLTDYKLFVQGGIIAEEVQVEARLNWPDYVFELDYELMPLSELDQYIKTNKHLPNVPSAQEVANKGFKLAEMDASLLRKVEELTLHTIEQHKSIEQLMEMNKQLMEANKLQQERIEKLESTVNKLK